ncbi:GNAT family N-acetyltransferase [Comamonas sp. NoAH]|uniref:GNAT family N-acetyltransferase n=1 Tax=Comamonas halotolerans TaxID=3041496 RepID=UPI0024E121F7|nr:GNAT family N-acetyltransferase [Comamonas sp. NoAH]
MPTVRASEPLDLPAITAIYRHHVLHGTGTFEIEPPTLADMSARRQDVLSKNLPWLVAESADGSILGYAYANWFKPRPAFRFSAEDSIYIADAARGQGIGKALLHALCNECEAVGVRKLIAVIGDSANTGSIALHHGAGFSHAGTLSSVGWKFDRWLDVVMMEKSLGAGDRSSPE